MTDEVAKTAIDGLECFVGKARVAVPRDVVDQVIEYEVSASPPLARRWVGGLAVHEGKILLSVALVQQAAATGARTVKGVLLQVADAEVGWVLEVAGVGSFVQVSLQPRQAQTPTGAKLPPWIHPAKTADARPIGWVDVPAMIRDLAGTA